MCAPSGNALWIFALTFPIFGSLIQLRPISMLFLMRLVVYLRELRFRVLCLGSPFLGCWKYDRKALLNAAEHLWEPLSQLLSSRDSPFYTAPASDDSSFVQPDILEACHRASSSRSFGSTQTSSRWEALAEQWDKCGIWKNDSNRYTPTQLEI